MSFSVSILEFLGVAFIVCAFIGSIILMVKFNIFLENLRDDVEKLKKDFEKIRRIKK